MSVSQVSPVSHAIDLSEGTSDFIQKLKKTGKIDIPFNDVIYELLYVEPKNDTYKIIFRRKDKPMCSIDFLFENEYDNITEQYYKQLYINFFECDYYDKPKGAGLTLLIALVDYMKRNIIQELRTIKLSAEPYRPIYNYHTQTFDRIDGGDLIRLVEYYKKIGFDFLYPEDEDDVYTNSISNVYMIANIDDFLELHHRIFKRKSMRKTHKTRKTRKLHKKSQSKSLKTRFSKRT